MGGRIVAVLENSIGPRLLLASRLGELGYTVTLLSAAESLSGRLDADGLEWLILDEAAVQGDGSALLEQLAGRRAQPRIAWLGAHPPASRVPIEVRKASNRSASTSCSGSWRRWNALALPSAAAESRRA